MICSIKTLGISGIQGSLITAECYISNGLPGFDIVGLPDAAVKEARERVRAAAKSSGIAFPVSRITVNLAPASLKKAGPHYDLPILLSVLAASGAVRRPKSTSAFLGEVGLDGSIRSVSGVLPMALEAKKQGIQALFVPAENAAEATLADGPAVYPVRNVRELADALNGEIRLEPQAPWIPEPETAIPLDFKDVLGQENVKRALEVAAAGSHNVLLIGPPGSGKSMLSKRLPSILPDMTREEALEVSKIYSVMGLLTSEKPLITTRPFRSPHHTVSNAGLAGGGSNPRPGEISMAHKGVLFLDEMPEFRKDTLDMMRQPLEDGKVTISRVSSTVTYPAEFMMVCAMNPCKCGWYGDPSGRCKCSQKDVDHYRGRISGPMLDRIDIVVEVPSVHFEDLRSRKEAEPSSSVKERVNAARGIQNQRFGNSGMCNARMGPGEMRKYCELNPESAQLMKDAFEAMGLTARSYDRILKVARTVADLDGSETIEPHHIAEAIQYRAVNLGNR